MSLGAPRLPNPGTVTAANGDTISTVFGAEFGSTASCPIVGILSGPFSFAESVTGGTGRFAGASGTYTSSGCFSIDFDVTSPTLFSFSVTYSNVGTISY